MCKNLSASNGISKQWNRSCEMVYIINYFIFTVHIAFIHIYDVPVADLNF